MIRVDFCGGQLLAHTIYSACEINFKCGLMTAVSIFEFFPLDIDVDL